jgi:hypothetical protein
LFTSRADRAARREERRSRRRGYLWRIFLALVIVVAGLAAATAHWFVWPPQQTMPAHVDAIVMLDGPGDRLDTALDLARAHRAPVIVIPAGSPHQGHGSACAPKIPGVTVICFDPNPSTTRGEEEFASHLATRYHWQSIVLVAVTPQNTPARIWAGRCFSGKTYMVNAPLPTSEWPYQIAYQWGSTIKAFFSPRSC